jgi:putative ABC transport system ATP-binding protein
VSVMRSAFKNSSAPVLPADIAQQAVRLENVRKVYGSGEGAVVALDDLTVGFESGSFTAVMGPSGSGKSTFLHIAAGLDVPTEGSAWLGGVDLAELDQTELTVLRRERVGFVFQAFNLMPSLTISQNVALPVRLGKGRLDRDWMREVVERTGLSDRLSHRPSELSGGQQQRVAIARALVTRPDVLFADEPTGALDTQTSREVLTLLREIVDATGQTVVLVTHDPMAAAHADSVVFLADGRVAGTLDSPTADAVAERMAHLGD